MGIVRCEGEDLDEITPCELDVNELVVVAIVDEPLAAEVQKGWQRYQIEVD